MMGKMGRFSADGMKKLQQELNKIQQDKADAFVEACAKELAARLLAMVIKRTPVGDYSKKVEVVAKRDSKNHKKGETYTKTVNKSGKKGGTLRRGWTARTHEEAASGSGNQKAEVYAQSLTIQKTGNMLSIEIINPVSYAPYVEYGHRTADHKGWVEGHFMLTISEQELRRIAPKVLENRLNEFLKGVIK